VGTIPFHHFWPPLEKFRKNPLVPLPGKNPPVAHDFCIVDVAGIIPKTNSKGSIIQAFHQSLDP